MAISDALDDLIAADKDVMLRLKGDPSPQPIGPGKVTKNKHENGQLRSYTYTLLAPAMINTPGGRPKQVRMPITFAAEDVLCLLGDIVMEDGEPVIVRPGDANKEPHPGNTSKGGFHIGGGS